MIFGREPALILALLAALTQLAIAFGLDLTVEQQGAIGAATIAVIGVWIRTKVTPVP